MRISALAWLAATAALAGCSGHPAPGAVPKSYPFPVVTASFNHSSPNPNWAKGKRACVTSLGTFGPRLATFGVADAPAGTTFVVRPLSHAPGVTATAVVLHAASQTQDYDYDFHDLGQPARVAVTAYAPGRYTNSYDITVKAEYSAAGRSCDFRG